MAFAGHFTREELNALGASIFAATRHIPGAQQMLVQGLPAQIAGNLPILPAPLPSIRLSLEQLNQIPRLTDGSVPIQSYLRNSLDIAGLSEALAPVRAGLARTDRITSGAPLVPPPETKERILGGHNDMVPIAFLEGGLRAARSVGKLDVGRFENGQVHTTGQEQTIYLGTGWMLADHLMITNHHVLNARNEGEAPAPTDDFRLQAVGTAVKFDFHARGVQAVEAAVTALEAFNADLDYAVVRLDISRPPLRRIPHPLAHAPGQPPIPVNIIQHPNGDPTKFGIRNNLVSEVSGRDVRYFTDTDGGSSGSPVFDDSWRVVALHRGSAFTGNVEFQGRSEAYVNLGTAIHPIVADLLLQRPDLAPALSADA